VQQVLLAELREEPRSSIRDFYVLTLEALDAGFLRDIDETETGDAERTLVGVRWPVGWGFGPALGAFLLFVPIGCFALTASGVEFPTAIAKWLLLLALVSVCLSLASVLAGCVLAGFGRQVYMPRIRFELGIPFFFIDTRDGFMGGRLCQAAVALQTLSAPFLTMTLGFLLQSPVCMLASCIAALYLTSPFGSTPAHNLLHALFRRAYHLPLTGTTFLTRKVLLYLVRFGASAKEGSYLLVYSAYAVAWLGALILVCNRLIQRQWSILVTHTVFASSPAAQLLTLLFAVLLFCLFLTPLVCQLWLLLRNAVALLAPVMFSAESAMLKRRSDHERPDHEALVDFLRDILLFAHLSEQDRQQLAQAMVHAEAGDKTDIVREGDAGDALFVIYAGKADVLKDDDAGNPRKVARLGVGDAFGEIALIERVPRTATVRSVGVVRLLVLGREDFERLLLAPLGSARIRTVIQVCSFLKRHPMFDEGPDRALLPFACEFRVLDFGAGDIIVREGGENDRFYMVYEGICEVRRAGACINTLSTGDFFGEISLLRGTPPIADVVAVDACRCLCLGREKFLQFVTRDALTGLAVERTMESRLPDGLRE